MLGLNKIESDMGFALLNHVLAHVFWIGLRLTSVTSAQIESKDLLWSFCVVRWYDCALVD